MRIYYERLINPVENVYLDKNTVENVLYLEDIVRNPSRDIFVQYKKETENTVSYSEGNITLEGVVKQKNHLYFVNYYISSYNDYQTFNNNSDNSVKIQIVNSNIGGGTPYKVDVYFNDSSVERIEYSDTYTLNNRSYIQLESETLGTTITVQWPLYLVPGEFVKYKINTINVTSETALHKYLATFDKVNNVLIFDRKYSGDEINILLQTVGSVLRSTTINELFRLNAQAFLQYDEATRKIILPIDKLYKDGPVLKYVKSQYKIIDPGQLNIGYNLLGFYLDTEDEVQYDIIMYDANYSDLIARVNNYALDEVRKSIDYYGFIIGLNNVTDFVPTDMWMFDRAGTGTGGVRKSTVDFTSAEELIVEWAAGAIAPIINF